MTQSTRRTRRIRWDEFDRLCNKRGWTTNQERAQRLGISPGHLVNMREGRDGYGLKFIDGCVSIWGSAVHDFLVEDVVDEETAR